MPTVDSHYKNSGTVEDCDKRNMDFGNGRDKGKISDEIRNIPITNQDDPHLLNEDTIENNSTNTSSTDESLKVKKLPKTEDSIPILQPSPNDSRNMFSSDEEGGLGESIIPPSPEALSPAAKRLLPGTPTRDSPSPNPSEHSNGNASSRSSSNHSKILHIRPSSFSKRITFSQDSNSQSDTPLSTKHHLADFLQRNVARMDHENSLKRSIKDTRDSNSDSSDTDSANSPKRRKDITSANKNLPSNNLKARKSYLLVRRPEKYGSQILKPSIERDPLLSSNQEEPLCLNAPTSSNDVQLLDDEILQQPEEINEDEDVDDLRLYLSATYTSPQKDDSDSEANLSENKNTNDESVCADEKEGDCKVFTNKGLAQKSTFSLNLPIVGSETEESQKELTPLSSVFAKVQQNDISSKNKTTEEKASALEPSVFNKTDNSSLLAECSQQTTDSSCSFEFGTESQEVHLQALHSTQRNRNLDTQDIAEGLFSQPFAANGSQKRTHSSDENERKKNMRTQDVETPESQCEIKNAAKTPVLCKIREKIVKQIYQDEFNNQGELIKSSIIHEETITEHFLDRASSVASYYNSLSSGELADHSSLPLSKSTSSMENLNVTRSSSPATNSGQLGRSKSFSTSSLDRSPPILKPHLPISANNVLNVTTSSSTSDELIFKTPRRVGRPSKAASKIGNASRSPKRKPKLKDTVEVGNVREPDTSPSISSQDEQRILPDPSDPNAIYSDMKIMAKWGDGFFYSGKLGEEKPNDEWQVIFDDGSIKDVKRQDFFPSSLIKPGQSVLALYSDGYFDSGVIQESYSLEQEEGYVIDFDKGFSLRCKRENVTLSADQAAAIIPSVSPTLAASKLLGPDLNLDNIVEGKRRRTPTTIISPMKYSLGKSGHDPNLDLTTETDSTTGSGESIKSRRLPNTSQGRKKVGINPKSPKKEDSSDGSTAKRSLNTRIPPKTNFCTACGETDKTHANVCPKTSPILQKGTRRKQEGAAESQSSPELRRLGSPTPPKRSQRVKRSLTTEFERMVHDTPEEKSSIFHGYYFLISCADRINEKQYDSSSSADSAEVIPFNKDYLLKLLELGGGQVLKTFEETQSVSSKKVFLISNTYLRTLKYIKCLASGIPCIKFNWVLDCCRQRKRLEVRPYHLPAGYSITDREIIPWHGCNTILKGQHILLVSKSNSMFIETWKPVLLAAQADAVLRIASQSTRTCMLNVIVSDQSCPGHVIRRASDLNIPIVSSEWIIQCLINGKCLPYKGHKKFNYMYEEN